MAIAAAGAAVAVKWNSEPFALLIVLGAALATPHLAGSITLSLCCVAGSPESSTAAVRLVVAMICSAISFRTQSRAVGGVGVLYGVTCAALAKLFLFDLAALNGVVLGMAFLAVGLLLLLVGTRYARAFGKQEQVNSASVER